MLVASEEEFSEAVGRSRTGDMIIVHPRITVQSDVPVGVTLITFDRVLWTGIEWAFKLAKVANSE